MTPPTAERNDPAARDDLLELAEVAGSDYRVAVIVIAACVVAAILLALLLL